MTIEEYQRLAQRTSNNNGITGMSLDGQQRKLLNGVLGLAGESGECVDLVKKNLFQGHGLDRDKLIEELGDVAWYLVEAAEALEIPLADIFKKNIMKLEKRYPEGFRATDSINREEYRNGVNAE